MKVNLSPDLQAFINSLVETGRFASADEAIAESLQLLASREQLKQHVRVGIEQADRGDLIGHDRVFANLRMKAAEYQDANSSRSANRSTRQRRIRI